MIHFNNHNHSNTQSEKKHVLVVGGQSKDIEQHKCINRSWSPTAIHQVEHSIVHSSSQPPRKRSEVYRSVLLEESCIRIPLRIPLPQEPKVFTEPGASAEAASSIPVHIADAVEAIIFIGVVEKGFDVRSDVNIGVIGVDAVAVVGVASTTFRLSFIGDLVVVPEVIYSFNKELNDE